MIKVAGYCRVSTDKDDQAHSFASQQRYFREYIQCQPDLELHEIYADEGITGTSTKKRTQFNRMIQEARQGRFQLILTKEVSRFSRNLLDTIRYTRELKAMGISVIFMTDGINTMDSDAELRLSIMASIAQEESRRTSSRVVWGQTRQMEKGVVFGQSLLGYDVHNGKITPNAESSRIVRLIFQKYAVEQMSTTQIANYLTEAGYRTCKGGSKWTSSTVIKILRNEKYVGDLVQKKSYTPDYLTHEKRKNDGQVPLIRIENHHEPIINRDVWIMTQERLARNNKHTSGAVGCSNRYVFSGKIECGECGSRFVGRMKCMKDGTKVRRWNCAKALREGTNGCDVGKLVREDDAMQMMKTALQSLSTDMNVIVREVTVLAMNAISAEKQAANDNPEFVRHEISRVQCKKEAALDSYFAGDLSKEDVQMMIQQYNAKLESLCERLAGIFEKNSQRKDAKLLKTDIQTTLFAIINGAIESDVFYKTILSNLKVFKDRHLELRLKGLPRVFLFAECS